MPRPRRRWPSWSCAACASCASRSTAAPRVPAPPACARRAPSSCSRWTPTTSRSRAASRWPRICLAAHPEAEVCVGDYEEFGNDAIVRAVPSVLDPYRIAFTNEYAITSLFRRSALIRHGGWRDPLPTHRGYEDWNLWMDLAQEGSQVVHLGDVMYRRRLHAPGLDLRGADAARGDLRGAAGRPPAAVRRSGAASRALDLVRAAQAALPGPLRGSPAAAARPVRQAPAGPGGCVDVAPLTASRPSRGRQVAVRPRVALGRARRDLTPATRPAFGLVRTSAPPSVPALAGHS